MFSICAGHVGLILCVLGFGSSGPGLNPVGSLSGEALYSHSASCLLPEVSIGTGELLGQPDNMLWGNQQWTGIPSRGWEGLGRNPPCGEL